MSDDDPTRSTPPSADRATHEPFLDAFRRFLSTAWEAVQELVRQGNRRRVTVRSRDGSVMGRAPLTIAVLVLLIAIPVWPLLLVLVVVGFAVGAQLSVERLDEDAGAGGVPEA